MICKWLIIGIKYTKFCEQLLERACWSICTCINNITCLSRYHRVFNEKSGRWTVHALKTRKQYNYIHLLLASALILRIYDRVGMKLTTLAPDDPRVISKHLAALEPPSTEELVRQQKSRFTEYLIYSTKHYLFVLTAFKVPHCI